MQIHFQNLSTVILSVANAIGGTKLLIISVPEFTDGSRIQSAPCSSQSGAGPHQSVPEYDHPAEHVRQRLPRHLHRQPDGSGCQRNSR